MWRGCESVAKTPIDFVHGEQRLVAPRGGIPGAWRSAKTGAPSTWSTRTSASRSSASPRAGVCRCRRITTGPSSGSSCANARLTRGEEVFLVTENENVYSALGETHRLENPGKVPLELIEGNPAPISARTTFSASRTPMDGRNTASQTILRRRRVARVVFFFLSALVIFLAMAPNLSLPEFEATRGWSDLLNHAVAFAALFILGAAAWSSLTPLAVALTAAAVLLEFAQDYSPGREPHVVDAVVSIIGVAIGCAVVQAVRRARRTANE